MLTVTDQELAIGPVLLAWAAAEPDRIARDFSPDLAAYASKAASGAPLTGQEAALALCGILGVRGDFSLHFLFNLTRWFVGSCPLSDVGHLHLGKYFESSHKVNGVICNFRNVAELAEGDPSFGVKGKFEWTSMRGRPALVSFDQAGPWCVLEGTHRLTDIYRAARAGTAKRAFVEVIVGICPEVRNWGAWRDPPPQS